MDLRIRNIGCCEQSTFYVTGKTTLFKWFLYIKKKKKKKFEKKKVENKLFGVGELGINLNYNKNIIMEEVDNIFCGAHFIFILKRKKKKKKEQFFYFSKKCSQRFS